MSIMVLQGEDSDGVAIVDYGLNTITGQVVVLPQVPWREFVRENCMCLGGTYFIREDHNGV